MPRLSKIGAAALAAFGWTGLTTVSASYLVVAGGGAGANGGGGGAGGLLTGSTSLTTTQSYTVVVGAGGGGQNGGTQPVNNGGNSSVGSIITTTGGGGGSIGGSPGNNGGSGGGARGNGQTGGTAVSGQGNIGGNGSAGNSGGGGGGAGGAGGNSSGGTGGNGGVGLSSSISGTATFYAGGGGAGAETTSGTGGNGGGGNGYTNSPGGNGTTNTGGGGGGIWNTNPAGSGGSGIVIISYPAPQKFGGGVITTSGSNVIHTFTTSGTLTPISTLSASYLIVAGGGGGGGTVTPGSNAGGGGGAGGLLSGSGLTIDTNSTYLVTVGAGATGTTLQSTNGSNSAFSMVTTTALGGGAGGSNGSAATYINGLSGGSGGGGSSHLTAGTGGAGTASQGNAGGSGLVASPNYPGGGGGGAGATGTSVPNGSTAGAGGAGLASSISGVSTYYAGGGGGAIYSTGGTAGVGGIGGGGAGANNTGVGVAGTSNTGGGGGGSCLSGTGNQVGGNGGSGIVIISYAGAVQQMAGGTVTISGGNVIHTFTSSGYLTPLKLVNNSLRFRASNAAYLNRTNSTTGTGATRTWTLAVWVKRGRLTADSDIYSPYYGGDGSQEAQIKFDLNDCLQAYDSGGSVNYFNYITTQKFRDPAAWYHIVIACDTTQAISTNRLKIYVNGTQVTSFSSSQVASQNGLTGYGGTSAQYIGCYARATGANNFDGEMSEYYFIDGQQLTPNSFGTFNSYGVWQPISYGGSYGTNGFYLPFSNKTSTTTLGYDFSPNGNNWTTNNISLTAGNTYDAMTDSPTLTSTTVANYAVLNPLAPAPNLACANGNLRMNGSGSVTAFYKGTLGVTSGKYYFEVTINTIGNGNVIYGVATDLASTTNYLGSSAIGWGFSPQISGSSYKYNNGTATAYGTATGTGTYAVAFDATSGKLWFSDKTGAWISSGNPATGTNESFSGLTGTLFAALGQYSVSAQNTEATINLGQQPFTYTPPSGFLALNTFNM